MKDSRSNLITNNWQHPTLMTLKKSLKIWNKCIEMDNNHPGPLKYTGNFSICWSDTQQTLSNMLSVWQKAVLPEATSFLCLHPSFPCGQRIREHFFLLSLQGTKVFSTPCCCPTERHRAFCLSKQQNTKAMPVFLNVVLFPAQLCKLAVSPIPSFLPVHSFPCLENC